MIPAITEHFGAESQYATLHQATISLTEMGERVITTQVRIDGDHVPDFSGWWVSFKGEKFVLQSESPQAVKDNTTRNSLVDLTFVSWPINELKRYYFFEAASISAGTAIADKYKASVRLGVEDFIAMLNNVLDYYFDGQIVADLYLSGTGIYSTERKDIEIDYSYLWDVIGKVYEAYDVRWTISYNSTTGVYTIKFGYPATSIDDHDFEYGYQGGLLKFERQVQDESIRNILLGRGGEKNLPYRYFKLTDPQNPDWAEDPDAIPELANINFDRLRDINFRWYVRGWMQNAHRDTSWDSTHTYPTYSISSSSPYYWAYQRGMTDEKFNPVEYVKDDDSIAEFGEHWGALDDNDEIYPTIQGRSRAGVGRIDETVAVSDIVTDDISAMASEAAVERSINPMTISTLNDSRTTFEILSEEFTIPTGSVGNVTYTPLEKETVNPEFVRYDTANTTIVAVPSTGGSAVPINGIPAGTYRLRLNLVLSVTSPATTVNGTFGIEGIVLTTSAQDADAWKPTFDIWVKNIWGTTKGDNESAAQYAARVWEPILGDRAGNEAKIVFSTGMMSVSEDYEFTIVSYPVYDTSRDINGVPSEWRITLRKSDAEFDATGLYIPNASTGGKPVAGDKFFFIGIDMPHMYVTLAEEDLNTFKSAQLDTEAQVNPTWVITLDKVRVNTLESNEYGSTLAERLAAGAKVRITDSRFTGGDVLTLYVQTITYTWNEPTKDAPYMVPDIQVVLSDKVVSTQSAVAKIQGEVSDIRAQYARISDVESVVRRVASPLFLKKTGESDSSSSPTTFSSKVTSVGFRQGGIGGAGWGIYLDNTDAMSEGDDEAEGDTVFEADRLVIRKELQVNSLVINQIEYVGGKEIISAAKIEISKVIETNSSYICYFDQKQNSVANLFQVNDIAYGQVWNADNSNLRYYKCVVTAVDVNCITLSKTQKDGAGVPTVGDVVVQYGNTTTTARQYVIIRDVIGGGYERMLSGLNSVSATGTEYYFAGKQASTGPRWFVGAANGEYAEWVNGQLNIKGRITVLNSSGTYTDMTTALGDLEYLTTALPESSTIISGGLILSKVIALTDANNNIMSGINGVPSLSTIAAWYGGPMADKEATPTPVSYAKSLFRFDGSGYLAGGKITWASTGAGSIPGVSWTADGSSIVIDGSVKLVSTSGDSVTELISAVNSIKDWFEIVDGNIHVKNNRGLYSDSFISAGGLSDSSGGGGVTVLAGLEDVSLTNLTNNDILKYNSTTQKWQNVPASSIGGVTSVAGLTGAVSASALSSAMGLGAAAYLGVGNVASGNAGLVTGGAVYSAINTAVASAIRFQGVTTTTLTDGSTTQTITIDGSSYTAQRGDVVIDSRGFEFLWTGSRWQQLGDETSYALKTVSITGTGYLAGGGNLEQSRTIDLSSSAATKLEAGNTVAGYFSSGILGSAHLPNMYIGTTSVQFSSAAQALTGITTATLSSYLTVGNGHTALTVADKAYRKIYFGSTDYYIEIDENGYLHTNVGFYSDSFVSAGGLSSSGGGGGIDEEAMWLILADNDQAKATQKIINASHIPDLTASKISDLSTWLSTNSYAKTTDIPSALKNPYSLTIGSVSYDGSVAKTVAKSDITTLLNWGTVGSVNQPVYINAGNPAAVTKMYTSYLVEPPRAETTITAMGYVDYLRGNHLVFLPIDQIIVEKTTDGGVTWEDAGATDSQKRNLFAGLFASSLALPKVNNYVTLQCGIRITIASMKYNVPEGTSETNKINYWKYEYVLSNERYVTINTLYIRDNVNACGLKLTVQTARQKSETTWTTCYTSPESTPLVGTSGGNVIGLGSEQYFGGSTTGTNQVLWRLTFMATGPTGDASFTQRSGSITISGICGYGAQAYTAGNFAKYGHLYTWDYNQQATFPGALKIGGNLSLPNNTLITYARAGSTSTVNVLQYSSGDILILGNGQKTIDSTYIYGKALYLCYGSNNGIVISSTGATTLYKATTLSETLTVTGATTLNNTLTVAEDANLNHGANLAFGYALRSKNSAGTSNLSMMYLSSSGLIIGDGTTQASNNTELRGNNIILKYSASATQGLKINSSGRIFIGASDTADSASGYANGQYLVWDATNKAWHLVGNFYADGFISAGGLSSSSGGGGIDADAMWTLLANTDSTHKINFAHIPDLSTDSSWTNADRGIGFSNTTSMGAIRYYNTDSSKGLTYNPNTGELKAGAFVKRGGTSSQFLKADGSVDSNSYALASALGSYVPLSGGTMTGALTLPTGSAASTTTAGLNIGSVAHIGAASTGLLGIYSTGNIVLRPNGASTSGNGLELTDSDITFNGVGLFRYGSYLLNDTTVDTIPTTYAPGMYSLTLNNVEYNAILHGVDRNSYWFQMRFKPYYGNDIWYRTRNTTTWRQFAFTDSTVEKANQLATSRSLWGNSFNGTADISGNIAVVLSGTDDAIVRATNNNGSISIIASSNRGLYDNTSSRWLIATNGTYNWIPNTVNLGIGTSTPAYTLDVVGAGYFSGGVNLANGQALRAVDNPSSGTAATRALAYLSTDNIYYLGSGTAAVGYDTRISGNNIVFRYSNQLSTGATLTSTGDFQIANTLTITNTSAAAHIGLSRAGINYITAPNTGAAIALAAGTSTLSRAASELFIESGHVQVTNALHLGNTTEAKAATMVWDQNANAWKLNGNFYATGFISAGGLSNSGGIDLTAVASNILPDTTDTRNLGSSSKMWSTTYTRYIDTASGYVLRIKTAGTQRMAISASGSYVGIGSDPNSSYSLYTSGAISCSSLTQRSDARLKDIIGDVELSVSDIAKAPAIFFRWKVGSQLGAGSLAQYWKELTPWCVIDDGKELAMDYGQISLLSVINVAKAVESHEQKIKRLETTVAAQQEEINRLRALTN